jgi:excisionase family DNA binding protein
MRVYLSSRFQRQQEIRQYAAQLRAKSVEVLSAWHDIESPSSDGFAGIAAGRLSWLAMLDLQQLAGSNAVIVFGEGVPFFSHQIDRGVRHVEAGVALAFGKRLLLVGDRENAYHCLPDIECFPAWPECLARVLELRGTDAMSTRQAAREASVTRNELMRWIHANKLPAAKSGGRYVIARNHLDLAKAREARRKADEIADVRASRLVLRP